MPDIWLFFPDVRRSQTADHRLALRRLCADRGWEYQERPSRAVRLPDGRNLSALTPDVADLLYRRLHRTRVAVLSIDENEVCVHPEWDQVARTRNRRGLRIFACHKAFYAMLRVPGNLDAWVPGFEDWCLRSDCEGERDPRILPHHVFESDDTHLEGLATTEGRVVFERIHGRAAARADLAGGTWTLNPHDFHGGRETLAVAGAELRVGCHWDVTSARGALTITTPKEVWQVSGHLNIYPDAHIRGTQTARRKIPAHRK